MFKPNKDGYKNTVIINTPFWPDINIGEFQQQRSIPLDIDSSAITIFILTAIAEVNRSLAKFEQKQKDCGYESANKVPGPHAQDGGESINELVAQYKTAVYARAKANMIGEYASLSRRDSHAGQDSPETKSNLLAEAAIVLRSIKGATRASVALI